MKRFFTILIAMSVMLGASQHLMAQEDGEWRVKGGVGWFSMPDFLGGLVAGLGSIDTTDGVEHSSFAPMLNPNLEIYYGISDWFSMGLSLGVGYAGAETRYVDTGAISKSSESIYPSLCIASQTRYFSSGKFAMYGSWGVGLMLLHYKQYYDGSEHRQAKIAPMTSLYPLCFSYGGSTGGFLEAGWGSKGFVNVGVYYNF